MATEPEPDATFEATFAAGAAGVAALAEPIRRDLYAFVSRAGDAVSREQAADGVGLPVHTAKFHLERLVDEGLLDVEFRRLTGRTGPGAGRPAKLYRRAERELSISIPSRHYDLLSLILATAVAQSSSTGRPVAEIAARVARNQGRERGERSAASVPADLEGLGIVLARSGYEPVLDDDHLSLANCPFHQVAQQETELVCGLNVEYVCGVVDGLGCQNVEARLDPGPGRCCVTAAGRAEE